MRVCGLGQCNRLSARPRRHSYRYQHRPSWGPPRLRPHRHSRGPPLLHQQINRHPVDL